MNTFQWLNFGLRILNNTRKYILDYSCFPWKHILCKLKYKAKKKNPAFWPSRLAWGFLQKQMVRVGVLAAGCLA